MVGQPDRQVEVAVLGHQEGRAPEKGGAGLGYPGVGVPTHAGARRTYLNLKSTSSSAMQESFFLHCFSKGTCKR